MLLKEDGYMIDLLQLAAQLGGVGGVLAIVIFFMYRQDRKSSEKRLTILLDRDQETREANTRIMAEVLMVMKNINGRGRKK